MEKTMENKNRKLEVTLIKSAIGFDKRQKKVLDSLGLRKLHTVKVFPDNSSIRGSLFKVKHLVKVREITN